MEIKEKLENEKQKILSTFFDEWLKDEQAKCDKIKVEISELIEQRDNRILELAKVDFPDKEINSIEDIDNILQFSPAYTEGFAPSAYKDYSRYQSVRTLNEQITKMDNENHARECDVTRATSFDSGEFLSKVAEIEQLESEISKLQKRLESVKTEADSEKTWYIERKNSREKLIKEFEESHKEVA